jgi:hypothetical protein
MKVAPRDTILALLGWRHAGSSSPGAQVPRTSSCAEFHFRPAARVGRLRPGLKYSIIPPVSAFFFASGLLLVSMTLNPMYGLNWLPPMFPFFLPTA